MRFTASEQSLAADTNALAGKVAAEAGLLTPVAFLVAAIVALFSAFSFAELAATTPILLIVFTLVNVSLWRVKCLDPRPTREGPCYPLWLSIVGSVLCLGLSEFQLILLWNEHLNPN